VRDEGGAEARLIHREADELLVRAAGGRDAAAAHFASLPSGYRGASVRAREEMTEAAALVRKREGKSYTYTGRGLIPAQPTL
jgi:hypothetical protein